MPLKIVRNDITNMHTDAVVNTANAYPTVGSGCDHAIYQAAGYDELLKYRTEKIGFVPEGNAFITPAFKLNCNYIIHAVSPLFINGNNKEEEKLRSCYKQSLQLALEYNVKSIAFPLSATGGYKYPKEEGLRIAVDELSAFTMKYEMFVYLIIFDNKATRLANNIHSDLQTYIDQNYVESKQREEYSNIPYPCATPMRVPDSENLREEETKDKKRSKIAEIRERIFKSKSITLPKFRMFDTEEDYYEEDDYVFCEEHESALEERIQHISDTFSEYLIYLIDSRGMTYPDVYKRAIVDKKVFSKIKNNPDAHPKKITAMCLCVGAKLNMDQTRDLLARAGYALSPCDKTDIIFSYFIENHIYDMIELDIQLEEHGLPCLIS